MIEWIAAGNEAYALGPNIVFVAHGMMPIKGDRKTDQARRANTVVKDVITTNPTPIIQVNVAK